MLKVMFLHLIQQQLIFALVYFGGPSSVNIKEVLSFTLYMMLRHQYHPFFTFQIPKCMTLMRLTYLQYEAGSFYVIDKAYIDFKRLFYLHRQWAYFVTRAKDNMRFNRMYSRSVDKTTGVKYDQIGKLETYYPSKDFPEKLRRIKYYDVDTKKEFIFLTNNTDLEAIVVAYLDKKRWEGELFFKWMKQHLKIKSFWGTTLNAVKIQIYCAIITYCLVALIGNKLKIGRSIYEILQILSISLLDKTPVRDILTNYDYKNVKEQKIKQLIISGF